MQKKYPGTTIEVLAMQKGGSRILFDGIFAAGGITLSQVSNMTGLEPYLIQNWAKKIIHILAQNLLPRKLPF